MGVSRNLSVGWYCEIPKSMDAYEICEEIAADNGKQWEEFIIGTDPMCGDNDHICIFNTVNQRDFDTSDHFHFSIPYLESKRKQVPPTIREFEQLVNAKYGDDTLILHYGVVNWFS